VYLREGKVLVAGKNMQLGAKLLQAVASLTVSSRVTVCIPISRYAGDADMGYSGVCYCVSVPLICCLGLLLVSMLSDMSEGGATMSSATQLRLVSCTPAFARVLLTWAV
jgi:hypothetical protein